MTLTGGPSGALCGVRATASAAASAGRRMAGCALMGMGSRGPRLPSVGAATREHGGNGLDEDLEVEGEGPVVDVLHVGLDPLVEVRDARVHLPQAGDAGLHAEAALVRAAVDPEHVAHRQWPRPDRAHVDKQTITELREVVEGEMQGEQLYERDAGERE